MPLVDRGSRIGPASVIRRGVEEDLPRIQAIQDASPEAARWNAVDYLQYDLWVCEIDGRIAGFAVVRQTVPGELELLNLAVAPELRRQGVARRLVEALLAEVKSSPPCSLFLEVRESNHAARALYKSLNFEELNARPNYYENPTETAIVMKFHSC